MCGRYSLAADPEHIKEHFALAAIPDQVIPRYNIAPTQKVLTVRRGEDEREAEMARWGLVPFYAKTVEDARRRAMINVKSEEALQKGYLRRTFAEGRILVPATAFYEWKKEGKIKIPQLIRRRDRDLMALGGLREKWTNPETGETVITVAILTTAPNELMAPIHNRMPLVLAPEAEAAWLDPALTVEEIAALMVACPSEWLMAQPISDLVGNVRNQGPELILPRGEVHAG